MNNLEYFLHESSYVDDGAIIGKDTKIWHFENHLENKIFKKWNRNPSSLGSQLRGRTHVPAPDCPQGPLGIHLMGEVGIPFSNTGINEKLFSSTGIKT